MNRDSLKFLPIFFIFFFFVFDYTQSQKIEDEAFALKWRDRINSEYQILLTKSIEAGWNFMTNMTRENSKIKGKFSKLRRDYFIGMQEVAAAFNASKFTDPVLFRWFDLLGSPKEVNSELLDKKGSLRRSMTNIYSNAQVELNGKQEKLEPELVRFMATSRDYDQLKRVWKNWRDKTGKIMRQTYIDFIKIKNKIARIKGYKHYGELITTTYESEGFKKSMEEQLVKFRPFYRLLHAYVVKKMRQQYGEKPFRSGHLPAHILGNMWAQYWSQTDMNKMLPFPDKSKLDVSNNMKKQNYTGKKIYELADNFFQSLGLIGVPKSFYTNSMFEKPKDRNVSCHPAAWDFRNAKDVRIAHCTEPTMFHLVAAHHEMGHIQYFMQYKNLPALFQRSANPGFHEAIGDAIALSVTTPSYMNAIKLNDKFIPSNESNLNLLMQMALDKIAFLPYAFVLDRYRWTLYETENFDRLNGAYWDLRCQYQGMFPPVYRSEEDFDPGAKYHIAADVPYIRYFFSYIFQFQLFKSMCKASNNKKPLFQCNFYQSKEAGKVLADGMKIGASKHWKEVMKVMVGETDLNIDPLLEYFEPLMNYLKKEVGKDVKDEWFPECPGKSFYGSSSTQTIPVITIVVSAIIGNILLQL